MSSKRNDIWNEHQYEAEQEKSEVICNQCHVKYRVVGGALPVLKATIEDYLNEFICDSCRAKNEAELELSHDS